MSSKVTYFLIPLALILIGTVILGRREALVNPDLRNISSHLRTINELSPSSYSFCGEEVPLQNPLIKSRLHAALLRNLRYRSSTILDIKRSGRYEKVFKRILKARGLPEDLYYLALVESNLSNAVSPKGATGFWQFMPASARQYGLEINEYVDERLHPEKATYAAARYFKQLYKDFQSWTLAAAAYNMGPGRLDRKLQQDYAQSYYQLNLNRETSQYVFRAIAFKLLIEEPWRFGLDVKIVYSPIPYRQITVKESIVDLSYFSDNEGVSYDHLKQYNPWVMGDELIVSPGKTYRLRLPTDL